MSGPTTTIDLSEKDPTKTIDLRGNYVNIPGLSRHYSQSWGVRTLVSRFAFIDINPPYQRDLVWKLPMKQKYVLAIFEGTATALFHLVQKSGENAHHYWCMDAKQRYSAIKDFWENKFTVSMPCIDGVQRQFYWKDIQEYNPVAARKFEDAQLNVEIYEPMEMNTQKLVFETINSCVPLTRDEILYGKNYLFQAFLKTLFYGPFQQISGFTKNEISQDKGRKGLRQIHIIMMISFGMRLDELFALKAYNQENRTRSANSIETGLVNASGLSFEDLTKDYTWDKETIEKVGWTVAAKQFENACRWLREMITYENAQEGMTKFDSGLCIDLICFLIKTQQEKVINSAFVRANIQKLHLLVVEWVKYKKVDNKEEFNGQTQDKTVIEKRIDGLYEVARAVELDMSVKSRPIPQGEKTLAALTPGYRDPIDGRALRKENMRFDHVEAKALGSESAVKILGEASNSIKSSMSQRESEKIAEYIDRNRKTPIS